MGQDEISASLAHVALCCVASSAVGRFGGRSYVHPGMHTNFLIHGLVGALHYKSGLISYDLTPAYDISMKATRYLAIPCLMADYHYDKWLSTIHLISGLVPFALAVTGQDNPQLGNLCVAANLVSLAFRSFQRDNQWGLYCAGAGALAYFAAPAASVKAAYPLSLALVEYCAQNMSFLF